MANLCVALTMLLMVIEAFSFSLTYGQVKRAFYGLGPTIIEIAIIVPGFENDLTKPYYDQSLLVNIISQYFESHLKDNLNQITIAFYYFDPITNMVCLSDLCQGVTIELNCQIRQWYTYNQTMSFSIEESG